MERYVVPRDALVSYVSREAYNVGMVVVTDGKCSTICAFFCHGWDILAVSLTHWKYYMYITYY